VVQPRRPTRSGRRCTRETTASTWRLLRRSSSEASMPRVVPPRVIERTPAFEEAVLPQPGAADVATSGALAARSAPSHNSLATMVPFPQALSSREDAARQATCRMRCRGWRRSARRVGAVAVLEGESRLRCAGGQLGPAGPLQVEDRVHPHEQPAVLTRSPGKPPSASRSARTPVRGDAGGLQHRPAAERSRCSRSRRRHELQAKSLGDGLREAVSQLTTVSRHHAGWPPLLLLWQTIEGSALQTGSSQSCWPSGVASR
jgi:hypothetical protein